MKKKPTKKALSSRIRELNKEKKEFKKQISSLTQELQEQKDLVNNFPPYAINAISHLDFLDVLEEKDVKTSWVRLLDICFRDVEKHDIVVEYLLVSPEIREWMRRKEPYEKGRVWSSRVVTIPDLKSVICLSNMG